MFNPLKTWIKTSREMELHHPGQYLSYYANRVVCTDTEAWMTSSTFNEMVSNCGAYKYGIPVDEYYCGRLFVRGATLEELCWFGIGSDKSMQRSSLNSRTIRICSKVETLSEGKVVAYV